MTTREPANAAVTEPTAGASSPVRRGVLYLGGYDPVAPEKFFGRLARELGHFRQTWGVTSAPTPARPSEDGQVWRTEIETRGDGWDVVTDFRLLAWDDLVKGDFARPIWQRIPLSLGLLADFLFSGTILRYFLAAWRFGLYFVAPFFFSLLFVIVAAIAAALVLRIDHWSAPWLAPVAFLAVYVGLMRWPGNRWFVSHLLDARVFMGEYMRGGRADMEARVDRFAREIAAMAATPGLSELVIIGHSQGSVFALESLERALALDPDLARRGPPISVMTVGSCVLQLGLHPAARTLRARAQRLQEERGIEWLEFQTLTDVVNFYKTDPAKLMRLAPSPGRTFPHVINVRIREMLQPTDYSRIRNSLFRVHYQFVMGNTRRYFYDFFLICCGPVGLRERFSLQKPPPAPDHPGT